MKLNSTWILPAVLIGVAIAVPAIAQNTDLEYLDVGAFDLTVASVKKVDSVSTKDGVVKAENRDNILVEVKLTGNTPRGGICIYEPSSFAAVYRYRGFYRKAVARAVGFRPEVAPGEIIGVFVSAPEASLNSSSEKASEEEIYIFFEIPGEVESFRIQIPMLIGGEVRIES